MSDFNINDSLGFYLSKGYTIFREAFNTKIMESGLNVNSDHWTVLVIVKNNPGISQTDISNYALRDKSSITRIIDFLEEGNYVERKNANRDRRSHNIFLTEHGIQLYDKLYDIAEKLNNLVLKDINAEDLEKFKETFRIIIKQVNN